MNAPYDLVIRNGAVFDGTGAAPISADVAVLNGKIATVGRNLSAGREEIDAKGLMVTPGFVDIHTHYDGQAIWSDRLTPSSWHGVTTAVMGNCGVGFAPCRRDERDRRSLIRLLEGVEDIPGVVMTEGLSWDWETFPDYLNAVSARARDINVAAYLPHSALRIYVMGERGARREPATAEDIERMSALAQEAVEAGAIGFSTSRLILHRTADGELAPSFDAAEAELQGIAAGLTRAGRGVLQIVLDFTRDGALEEGFGLVRRLVAQSGRPLSFTIAQSNGAPDDWRGVLEQTSKANAEGLPIRGQFLPRPMGIVVGHTLSANPFSLHASYRDLVGLDFETRMRALRDPDVKRRILDEEADLDGMPLAMFARDFSRMFPLSDRPDYEPHPSASIAAQAAARGVSPAAFAYDALLEDDGEAKWFVAFANYAGGDLEPTLAMLRHPDAVLGLGDGGAHYGLISDSSYSTTMLTHWTRDRTRGERISIEAAVHELTQAPAQTVRLIDRGVIAEGYAADLNVIDYDALSIGAPYLAYDLPAGGKRLSQRATGYEATIVGGEIIYRNGEPTGALPGRLLNGQATLG